MGLTRLRRAAGSQIVFGDDWWDGTGTRELGTLTSVDGWHGMEAEPQRSLGVDGWYGDGNGTPENIGC